MGKVVVGPCFAYKTLLFFFALEKSKQIVDKFVGFISNFGAEFLKTEKVPS